MWSFRRMSKSEPNTDTLHGEFFTESDLSGKLVRETLQNCLDASSKTGPVRVRFALSSEPLQADRASTYLDGLEKHLASLADEDGFDPALRAAALAGKLAEMSVPFLAIEDFGTTGLVGDETQYDDWSQQPAIDNSFYWFFRNVGRSGKGEGAAGSWGVGKWVFPNASRINALLALTRRSTDERTLLMGDPSSLRSGAQEAHNWRSARTREVRTVRVLCEVGRRQRTAYAVRCRCRFGSDRGIRSRFCAEARKRMWSLAGDSVRER